jgi:hypothetical protein
METDHRTVYVYYPDGHERQTTVSELLEFYKDETADWKFWFFKGLLIIGEAHTRFASYHLNKKS